MSRDLELLHFYAGAGLDSRGRLLREIQNWSDEELERTHDYIQWLFPLDEPSGSNMDAPVLDAHTISQFRSRAMLRRRLQVSLLCMLAFYGLEIRGSTVTRAASFTERAPKWVTPSNHNHLRITRILKSLRLLGLGAQADALFDCLAGIYQEESRKRNPGVSQRTFGFWESAAHG